MRGANEMPFYKFSNPYYALVRAKNEKEAIKLYRAETGVEDIETPDEELEVEESKLVKVYQELRSAVTEDGEKSFVYGNIEEIRNEKSRVILIDSSLL